MSRTTYWVRYRADFDFITVGRVIQIESTHDGRYIWLQTNTKGFLVDTDGHIKTSCDMRHFERRIYGNDKTEYIHIDRTGGIAYINGKEMEFPNIISAVIDHNRDIISLTKEEYEKYTEIRLVSWEPYYITAF